VLVPGAAVDAQKHFEDVELAYAQALRPLTVEHPQAAITHALLAQALMLQRPWMLWKPTDASPRELRTPACAHVPEIERTLAVGLALSARHPLLVHMWIHAYEMAPDAAVALPQAQILAEAGYCGDVGHLNHMAAHVFGQCGQYSEGIAAGLLAVASDQRVENAGFGQLREQPDLYFRQGKARGGFSHNLHKLMFDAMCANDRERALDALQQLEDRNSRQRVLANPTKIEPFGLMKYHCWIRFGCWDLILNHPVITDLPLMAATYANQRYARGVALAALGEVDAADEELAALIAAMQMSVLLDNGALSERKLHNIVEIQKLYVAVELLRGEIAYRRGDLDSAFDRLKAAVHLDDNLPFDEPAGWMVPARHALGALLSESGDKDQARVVYEEDLRMHPNNVWALSGLVGCLAGAAAGSPEAVQLETVQNDLRVQAQRTGVKAPTASCACALTKWNCEVPVTSCCQPSA